MMYRAISTQEFDESYSSLMQDFLYWSEDDADSIKFGFRDARDKALLNVKTMPEAYPRTVDGYRWFTFSYKSVPLTVFYRFCDGVIILVDIDYSRSGRVARRIRKRK